MEQRFPTHLLPYPTLTKSFNNLTKKKIPQTRNILLQLASQNSYGFQSISDRRKFLPTRRYASQFNLRLTNCEYPDLGQASICSHCDVPKIWIISHLSHLWLWDELRRGARGGMRAKTGQRPNRKERQAGKEARGWESQNRGKQVIFVVRYHLCQWSFSVL